MTEIAGQSKRFSSNHWIPFLNNAEETIPAYAVLRITGTTTANDRNVLTVAKPDATSPEWYAVNGPAAVASGKYGECTLGPSCVVQYTGTPSPGDNWGPTDGNWEIATGGSNFVVLGTRTNTRSLDIVEAVQLTSTTAASSAYAEMNSAAEQELSAGNQTLTMASSAISSGVTVTLASNQFEIVTAGVYAISIWGQFYADGIGAGAAYVPVDDVSIGNSQASKTDIYQLLANDTVGQKVIINQTTLANLSVSDTVKMECLSTKSGVNGPYVADRQMSIWLV